MKPQSLQDAIKAKAAKQQQARQAGGWKEPAVKKYTVTAEDLARSPKRDARTLPSTPAYFASPVQPAFNNDVMAIKKAVEVMQTELKQQRVDITTLRTENKELRDLIRSLQSATTNSNPTSSRAVSPSSDPVISSPKKAKTPASVEPHSTEDLADAQRLDKAMRHFMRTQEGLYDGKHMSIREEKDGRIICFKNKIYIPLKLRDVTIKHYKNEHPTESVALAALRKNCCWPDLEKDFFEHKE